MVTSKLLGDGPAHGRHIPFTAPHVAAVRGQMDLGVRVFAFAKSATRLRLEGAEVSFAPVRLLEGSLDRFLARLPDDVIVALGVPGGGASAFAGVVRRIAVGHRRSVDARRDRAGKHCLCGRAERPRAAAADRQARGVGESRSA